MHLIVAGLGGRWPSRVDDLLLGGDPRPGEWMFVHAGLALSKCNEREAQDTLALLEEMSEVFAGQEGAATPATTTTATREAS